MKGWHEVLVMGGQQGVIEGIPLSGLEGVVKGVLVLTPVGRPSLGPPAGDIVGVAVGR